jgi:hypothetical protein
MIKPTFLSIVLLFFLGSVSHGHALSEEKFDAGMKKVNGLMSRERWSDAYRQLKFLLKNHENQAYVVAKSEEIRNCAKTCIFRKNYTPRSATSLVSGQVVSYHPSSGKIKLRYAPNQMGDFIKREGKYYATDFSPSFLHEAVFTGPYTIEMNGKSYPNIKSNQLPTINVCKNDDTVYSVKFGFMTETTRADGRSVFLRSVPPRIFQTSKTGTKEISAKAASPARSEKPFRLKVVVTKTRIAAYFNGKLLLRASHSKSINSRFGFKDVPFDEILIKGKIDPEWLQKRQEAAEKIDFETFEKSFIAAEHLPEWLLEGLESVEFICL